MDGLGEIGSLPDLAAPRLDPYPISLANAILGRGFRMNLQVGLVLQITQVLELAML